MLLSCPSCSTGFNLDSVEAEYVKCPVCYNVWQIDLPRVGLPTIVRELSQKSEEHFAQNNTKNYSKYWHTFGCLLIIVAFLYQFTHQYIRHLYCAHQVQIRDLRWSIIDGQTQIYCQVDNIGDRTICLYRADLTISKFTKKERLFVWINLVLPPYTSLNLYSTIPNSQISFQDFDLTIRLK